MQIAVKDGLMHCNCGRINFWILKANTGPIHLSSRANPTTKKTFHLFTERRYLLGWTSRVAPLQTSGRWPSPTSCSGRWVWSTDLLHPCHHARAALFCLVMPSPIPTMFGCFLAHWPPSSIRPWRMKHHSCTCMGMGTLGCILLGTVAKQAG